MNRDVDGGKAAWCQWARRLTTFLVLALCLQVLPAQSADAPPITLAFDHFSTGFELDGIHRDLPCESCHLNAIFKGTPRNCGVCHVTGSIFNGTPKSATHVLSTNNCAACHDTASFRPDVHFDHAEVLGTCASCHNGTTAQGKGASHPVTTDACEACHTVMSWNPPKSVDHAQIPMATAGFCIICHNGTQASGKPPGHVATTLECGDCHLTSSWLGASFDHVGIMSGCSSCHDGVKAVGKRSNHLPTTQLCETCHRTGIGTKNPSWVPSGFDHTQMVPADPKRTCETCHSGSVPISTGVVSGPPANHLPLNAGVDCVVCHGNNPQAETWKIVAASVAQLHTGLSNSGCTQCHGGQAFAGVPAPYTPMPVSGAAPGKPATLAPSHIPILTGTDCSACHATDYRAGGFGPATAMNAAKHAFVSATCDTCHDTGRSFYVGGGTALQLRPADHLKSTDPRMASGDCSACHNTTDWGSSGLPAGHMPNPGNQACTVCHTAAPGNFKVFAANSVLHTGITGNCSQCHGAGTQLSFYNDDMVVKDSVLSPAHIPFTSGTDCSSCHRTSSYASGTFGPMNMTQATHAFVTGTCNTCHGTPTAAYYMGSANPGLQLRPADHNAGTMLTGDCSGCHTTANWNTTALPSGHMPNPANQSCGVCHTTAPTDYTSATLAANPVLHTGITGNCGQCHGATSPLTWYQNFTPKDAVLSPSHIPYTPGTDCSACHARNYLAGGFGPTTMNPAKHAFVPSACDTCHEANLSYYMGASTPALQGRPADHRSSGNPQQATGDCSGCHTTTDWTATIKPANHMPTPGTQSCAVCHTAIGSTEASYKTLASISVLHTGVTTGMCSQCHGNTTTALTWYANYTPKDAVLAPAHIPYLVGTDCGSCHTANYTAGGFGPTNMSAAKHAFVPSTCDTCHDKNRNWYLGASTPSSVQGRPPTHVSAPNPAAQATGDCSLCHNTTTWAAPKTLPNNHMPIPGTQTCATCHIGTLTADPASYAPLAGIPILHTGITSGCAQCHGGPAPLTFYNNNDNPKAAPANHIPSFAGNDCSGCHVPNYTTGGFGPMNMTQATHVAVATTTCVTCHEAGKSFYMGSANPALQTRPTDHTAGAMLTGDCSVCHTTANWNSTNLPSGHMPNPGNQACAVCHTSAPSNYKVFAANSVLHTGITGNCSQCHGAGTQLSFYNNDLVVKDSVLTPAHIPFNSGTDCSSCHAGGSYAAGGFGPMNMTQATHTFVSKTCDTCHGTATAAYYIGAASPGLQLRPANHSSGTMKTSDCSACHTTANWNSTSLPSGHMPNPANQTCAACHTSAPTDYGQATLAANSVLHRGITGNCGQCHGGTTALTWYNNFTPKDAVLSPAHIPYAAGTDCSSCHKTSSYAAGAFGPMNMTQATHTFVSKTCDTCHGTATAAYYIGAASPGLQLRPADHNSGSMLTGDCSGCHTTANWNTTSLPSGHMPNPGNQACAVCHTSAPTNYKVFAANSVIHTGITGNCSQCHGAGTQLSFFNNDMVVKDSVLTPAHIPFTSGTDCSSCHKTGSYAAGTFGPMNMTQATHSFVPATCVSCHEAGVSLYMGAANPALQGRPTDHNSGTMKTSDCSGCHTTANWNTTSLPAGHMPNPGNQACAVCHTSAPTNYKVFAANSVIHTGITGNCSQCHGAGTQLSFFNNDMVVKDSVLTPAHIPFTSGTDCSSCHKTGSYAAGTFGPMNMTQATHSFVPATCVSCHEAGVSLYMGAANPALQGRPTDHNSGTMKTSDCSGCHTTANWNTTSLPAGHMPNPGNQACAVCHTSAPTNYKVFAANSVIHTGITGNCSQCHGAGTQLSFFNNDMVVKDSVLTPAHIPFTSGTDCSSCHKTGSYAAGTFGPMNMTQATHAFVSGTCNTCHGTPTVSFTMGAASPGLQLRPADHNSGSMLTGDCSGCHTTANWNTTSLPAGHMPNPGNQTCAVCHTSAPSNYKVFAANSVLHTGITGNCSQCHGAGTQLSFYNNDMVVKDSVLTPAHIPFTSGTDCSSCHKTGSYAAGTFGPMNMTQATHAFVSGTCNTCHGTPTVSFTMGAASPGLQLRPADHNSGSMLTGDCSGCHTTANWNTTSLPAGHMPNPGNQTCAVCHTSAPSNYKVFAANSVLHTGITGNCSQCHGAGTQLSFFNNDMVVKDSVLTPAHIPFTSGTDCSSCHKTGSYAAGTFGPMNMTQATHSFVPATCVSCHEAGVSLYMGAANPALQGRPTDHNSGTMKTSDCSACHTTANWNTTSLPAGHMPNPGNQACAVCHTSAPTNYKVFAANSVIHTGITGNCSQCHGAGTQLSFFNNDMVVKDSVLTPAHIPFTSGTDCSSCHKTGSYAAGTFGPMNMTQATHSFVPATCVSCHEAGVSLYMGAANPALQGRPTDHNSGTMKTSDCSGCHTTANWNTTSLPAGHMPNPGNQACAVCHTSAPTNYKVFAANSVLHTGITGNCSQCHGAGTQLSFFNNDMVVKDSVLTPAHIPFTSGTDCSSCHKTGSYAAGTFGPMNMTQATHSFVPATCVSCHEAGVSLYMGAANPALQGRPGDHSSGTMKTSDCSACHTTANWNTTSLPAGHMPNPGNQACAVCHTSAPTNYKVFAANSVIHTGITGNCSQCHGAGTQLSFFNNDMVVKDSVLTPAHIPFTSGTDCSSCHKTSSYATGTFGPMNMTQATHSFVPATCVSCHEAGVSLYMGAANPALQGRPGDHNSGTMKTSDCSACHTTANWNSTSMPSNHMPNPANQACSTCHTKSSTGDYTQATLAPNSTLHTGISSGCITCHGAPNATAPVYANGFTPKPASGLSPPHIPTGATSCEKCHSAGSFTSFGGTSMNSAKHTSMFAVIGPTCDACHNRVTPALSFYGVNNLTVRPTSDPHNKGNALTNDCSGCHSPSDWGGGAQARKQTTAAPASAPTKVSTVVGAGTAALVGIRMPKGDMRDPRREAGAVGTAAVSHAGVIANCSSCHNGVLAAGKGPTHVTSNMSCENCHTTSAWIPARFDHRGVTAACTSCHDGVKAPGKPARHIQTTQDCAACHGTLAWLPALFNHVGVSATCQSCHNGITATGKQPQHVVTTQDCATCHSTLGWTVAGTGVPKAPLHPLIAIPRLGGHTPAGSPPPRQVPRN